MIAHDQRLRSRRPLAGAERDGDGYLLRWQGCGVMGVVNVTPDSFSDGGRHLAPAAAVAAARAQWAAGATWIDVGGASTRPGATPVAADVEAERVVPVVRALRAEEPGARISVDTSDPGVARAAVVAGAGLVNDVRGLRDPALRVACAELGVPAVVSHLRGEPATMHHAPAFDDVVAEVVAELRAARSLALDDGVPDVVLDPGLGFGKTTAHNRALLRATAELAGLGGPLLVGASRKRSLGEVAGEPVPERRDAASLAAHLYVAARGAALVRVHDVAAHVQALRIWRWLGG
ncbi:MAG: dihydropteroate synthase [Trueperaceae bacterium]